MEIPDARMACYGWCMEITLLFILMKYSRYMSHFIRLVHIIDLVVINTLWSPPIYIFLLQVSRWRWYAKFACYCSCISITLIGSFWISFLLVLSSLPICVSIRVPISLAFVVLIICRPFGNYSCILILNPDPHACVGSGDCCLAN